MLATRVSTAWRRRHHGCTTNMLGLTVAFAPGDVTPASPLVVCILCTQQMTEIRTGKRSNIVHTCYGSSSEHGLDCSQCVAVHATSRACRVPQISEDDPENQASEDDPDLPQVMLDLGEMLQILFVLCKTAAARGGRWFVL